VDEAIEALYCACCQPFDRCNRKAREDRSDSENADEIAKHLR